MPVITTVALALLAYAPPPEHTLDARASELSVADKPVNVVVAKSTIPHAGRGVFAARDYAKCELIEEAQSIPLTDAEYPVGALRQYLFDSQQNDNKTVLVLEHGSLFNHGGESAQVGYRPGKISADGPKTFQFYALRPIAKGEELFIHYGYEPHPVQHVTSLDDLDESGDDTQEGDEEAGDDVQTGDDEEAGQIDGATELQVPKKYLKKYLKKVKKYVKVKKVPLKFLKKYKKMPADEDEDDEYEYEWAEEADDEDGDAEGGVSAMAADDEAGEVAERQAKFLKKKVPLKVKKYLKKVKKYVKVKKYKKMPADSDEYEWVSTQDTCERLL